MTASVVDDHLELLGDGGTAADDPQQRTTVWDQAPRFFEMAWRPYRPEFPVSGVSDIEIFEAANALGIGAQGLGGLSTVLDVKILDYPTHAASKPVGMIPNCAATRHAHFTLDGSGAVKLDPPDLARWPDVHWAPSPASKGAAESLTVFIARQNT